MRRVQLRRERGWRLPDGARSVAYPTPYANTFRPASRSREANAVAVERYRAWLMARPDLVDQARRELAGRDLACWCPPQFECHADVLLAIANDAQDAADTTRRP